ncbi:MAG: hypothetical protein EAZ92_10870 [Candidatus Kapaibacterium sp.]|nr:MAG: hypothetical protein EAZ92_10870 [Candidatus Kapabacteria bacterium]
MTKRRALALALSALWIMVCAISVFAADKPSTQALPTRTTTTACVRLDCSRSDLERIPAEAFDEMSLTELLTITMETDADSLTMTMTTNAQATNDFMHLLDANTTATKITEQMVNTRTPAAVALSTNGDTAHRKTSAPMLRRK